MGKYWEIFVNGYSSYANYLWTSIGNPSWNNYFYWLIAVSAVFFVFEGIIPWRKKQSFIRQDFWLDAFYMFFNFFIFSLIIYNAASDVFVNLFRDGIGAVTGVDIQFINPMKNFPYWSIILIGFVVRDFVQWWIHRLLHFNEKLWEFHKVHHSVEQMGFAAHLRYHWMENVVYRTLEYIPLALLGIGLYDFFVIHIFTLAWGHYNHANISVDKKITGGIVGFLIGIVIVFSLADVSLVSDPSLTVSMAIIFVAVSIGAFVVGPIMKYIFNSPEMHIWHHSYELPEDRRNGVNFGLTLAMWDYLFGTAYIPKDGREIKLGFPGVEKFPTNFIEQNMVGVKKSKNQSKTI